MDYQKLLQTTRDEKNTALLDRAKKLERLKVMKDYAEHAK